MTVRLEDRGSMTVKWSVVTTWWDFPARRAASSSRCRSSGWDTAISRPRRTASCLTSGITGKGVRSVGDEALAAAITGEASRQLQPQEVDEVLGQLGRL